MTAPDQYRVVFDLSQKGFEWWFPACGLVFVVIGAAFLLNGSPRRSRKIAVYFIIGFGVFWFAVTFRSTYKEYAVLHSAYRRSQFSVVEGRVTNFRPMPFQGHAEECFSVQSQTFCYSDFELSAGFNNSAAHGGPIREGLPVRVFYVGSTIVRLEVGSDNTDR